MSTLPAFSAFSIFACRRDFANCAYKAKTKCDLNKHKSSRNHSATKSSCSPERGLQIICRTAEYFYCIKLIVDYFAKNRRHTLRSIHLFFFAPTTRKDIHFFFIENEMKFFQTPQSRLQQSCWKEQGELLICCKENGRRRGVSRGRFPAGASWQLRARLSVSLVTLTELGEAQFSCGSVKTIPMPSPLCFTGNRFP